jgi:signal transduction histidine kinase
LRIADDGSGFDVPARPSYLAQEGHFGLLGMKERAQLHNGTLQIESQADQGTVISVHLPLYEAPISQPPSALFPN